MSHPEREAPAVRPRRQVNPPAYLEDFELRGPGFHRQQPRSLTSQGELEDEPASTTGHSRSTSPVEQLPELAAMMEEMKRENAALQRQASQLPEIISAVQQMRQQNAALYQELQNLKSERKSPPKPVTPPMPSPRSYSRAVNIQTPQLYRPIPAPCSRLPPRH
ncbi:hypothetical protein ROHU_017462 [Labeo rohita]|uniref:Uncharacterized protein n=1 Tax=Labeo rohita TaxID=84645 RepID=A0A498LFM2_LABRO|nr:hypothetical protein ROHU_032449 [Labeo rohita]RXN30792.1 hypothetical protein ROHU_017462 [Labeo rohita]